MKNTKKIISVLLSLAMLAAMSFVTATVPASAAAGDTWTLTHTQTVSPYIGDNITHRTSDHMFTVNKNANSGNSFFYNHFLLTNGSDNAIKADTTYRITFDVSAQNKTIDLYSAKIGHYFYKSVAPTGPQIGLDLTTYNDLTPYAVQYEWGDYKKYHIAIDYTTPSVLQGSLQSIPKNNFLDVAVTFKTDQNTPIYITNVRTLEYGMYSVVDENGEYLGTAYGLVGDSTASLIDSSLVGDDYTFTTSPATISTLVDTITLTKTLKMNIAQKINFGSGEYLGNSDDSDGHYYSKVAGDKRLIKQETSIKGEGVNVGANFGNRSIVLANNRYDSGLVAGNTYRINLKFNSWYALSNFGLQVKFGRGVWNTISAGAETYTGSDFTDLITTLRPLTSNQSGNYLITLDVTLPETEAWGDEAYKNIIVSLYGTGSNAVEYWLSTTHIYKKTTTTVTNNDGSFTATVLGFEGDSISSAVSDDGAAKFLNVTDKFGFENKVVMWDTIIFRGDANANFTIDDADFTLLVDYLFEKPEAAGADLFGLNVIYGTGNEDIDICDLVALEMILESE